MRTIYYTAYCGSIKYIDDLYIDKFFDMQSALAAINQYENEDKITGTYHPSKYCIVSAEE